MVPEPLPSRPDWRLTATAAGACVLVVLAALLGIVGYEPGSPVTDARPAYVSSAESRELEDQFRAAGHPVRSSLYELIATADGREELYGNAKAIEGKADISMIVRMYSGLARAGHGKSARRLAELYDRGASGLQRDYSKSLEWYERARQLGEEIPMCCKR